MDADHGEFNMKILPELHSYTFIGEKEIFSYFSFPLKSIIKVDLTIETTNSDIEKAHLGYYSTDLMVNIYFYL